MSNRRRPETRAPALSIRSRSIAALASSTLSETPSLALGTLTSPASYQSKRSSMPSFGSAMNPSSDIVMCVKTLLITFSLRFP
jgi:hypothetical protein